MRTGKTVRVLAAAAVASGALLVPATAAHAVVTSCTGKLWSGASGQQGWSVTCGSTDLPNDEWRATAVCVRENHPSTKVNVVGSWTGGANQWSSAICAANYYVGSGSQKTRTL